MSVKELASGLSEILQWDSGLSEEISTALINAKSPKELVTLLDAYIPAKNTSARDLVYKYTQKQHEQYFMGSNVKVRFKGSSLSANPQQAITINCLKCGKVQPQSAQCNFCEASLLPEDRALTSNNNEATELKDRLVLFDRESATRTTVLDDQSDSFAIDSNAWLSDEERALLRAQQQAADDAEAARRKRVVISIDLLGRRVLSVEEEDGGDIDTTSSMGNRPATVVERAVQRMKASPSMEKYTANPFMIPNKNKKGKTPINKSKDSSMTKQSSASRPPRLQHDIVELLPDDLF